MCRKEGQELMSSFGGDAFSGARLKADEWLEDLLMAGRVFPKVRQHPAAARCS